MLVNDKLDAHVLRTAPGKNYVASTRVRRTYLAFFLVVPWLPAVSLNPYVPIGPVPGGIPAAGDVPPLDLAGGGLPPRVQPQPGGEGGPRPPRHQPAAGHGGQARHTSHQLHLLVQPLLVLSHCVKYRILYYMQLVYP